MVHAKTRNYMAYYLYQNYDYSLFSYYSDPKHNEKEVNPNEGQKNWIVIAQICSTLIVVIIVIFAAIYKTRKESKIF